LTGSIGLASRLGDAAQAGVVVQDEVAGAQGGALKIGVIAGNEKPVTDFAADGLDRAKRRQVLAETCVGWIGPFCKDEPDAVVLGKLCMLAEHHEEAVVTINRESGKHPAHLGMQGREGFEDEGVRRFRLGFGGRWHLDKHTGLHRHRVPRPIGSVLRRRKSRSLRDENKEQSGERGRGEGNRHLTDGCLFRGGLG
jgi:hypothetical protein